MNRQVDHNGRKDDKRLPVSEIQERSKGSDDQDVKGSETLSRHATPRALSEKLLASEPELSQHRDKRRINPWQGE
jgi:hypothetical protein